MFWFVFQFKKFTKISLFYHPVTYTLTLLIFTQNFYADTVWFCICYMISISFKLFSFLKVHFFIKVISVFLKRIWRLNDLRFWHAFYTFNGLIYNNDHFHLDSDVLHTLSISDFKNNVNFMFGALLKWCTQLSYSKHVLKGW